MGPVPPTTTLVGLVPRVIRYGLLHYCWGPSGGQAPFRAPNTELPAEDRGRLVLRVTPPLPLDETLRSGKRFEGPTNTVHRSQR